MAKLKSLLPVLSAVSLSLIIGILGPARAGAKPLLQAKGREKISDRLSEMDGQVDMVMFTQEIECQYCAQTRELLVDLASMSEKLNLTVYDFLEDWMAAERYGVDKIPATVLIGKGEVAVQYYGVPAGYELAMLVETIVELSVGDTGLSDEIIEKIQSITEPVHIQVFVTPTCPYCPGAIRTAYQLAQVNEHIRADGIEAIEFPHLANKYHVRGVPKVVINESTSFVGAQSDLFYVEKILEALEQGEKKEDR